MSRPTADAAVRPARPADADPLALAQDRAWQRAYAGLIPEGSRPDLRPAALAAAWRVAITDPPSDRHQLLVATAADQVVGFVAVAPASDPDTRPDQDGEIVVLVVDPAAEGDGHGSRLLNAAADLLRQNGFGRVRAWVPSADRDRQRFLAGAGLRADGATRVLADGVDGVGDRPQGPVRPIDGGPAVQPAAAADPAGSVREERWSAVLGDGD